MLPDRAFFYALADAAKAETLPRFRTGGYVTNKLEGGCGPVTEADREAEQAIRALIRAEHPGHGILGEEFGSENLSSDHVWVIGPVDGTRSFISGIPLWGTLVGLTERGDAVAGMMAQPFIGELIEAQTAAGTEPGGGPGQCAGKETSGNKNVAANIAGVLGLAQNLQPDVFINVT